MESGGLLIFLKDMIYWLMLSSGQTGLYESRGDIKPARDQMSKPETMWSAWDYENTPLPGICFYFRTFCSYTISKHWL